MSDNIIPFSRPPAAEDANDRVVWRCNCGCLTFFVRADQEIECAQCGSIAADCGEWRAREPEQPAADVPPVGADDVTVTDLGAAEHAIRRVMKKIDHANIAGLIVINSDGSLSAWGSVETPAESRWMRSRVSAALKLMGVK